MDFPLRGPSSHAASNPIMSPNAEGANMLIYLQMIETDEDQTRFVQIYEKYRGLMFSVAYRILGSNADAEDAVHRAFVSIIDNLNKIKVVDSVSTKSYLVILTEHKAIDMLRKNKRYISMDTLGQLPGIELSPPGDSGLADAMAQLPAIYREVLLLRYYHGYTTKEIARMLHMTSETAQKTIWRAKQSLHQALQLGGAL